MACAPDLAKRLDALLRLVPEISIPLLIKEILEQVVIAFLVAYKNRILLLASRLERIAQAETKAATLGAVQLQTVVDCARADVDVQLANLNASLAPLNRLIGVLNALLELAGLKCIPTIDGIDEATADALVPVDKVIAILQALADLIPAVSLPEFGGGAFAAPCNRET